REPAEFCKGNSLPRYYAPHNFRIPIEGAAAMATQSPGFSVPLADLAATLLAQREISPRARTIAEFVLGLVPDAAIVVYAVHDQEAPEWKPEALLGEVSMQEPTVDFTAGTLGAL